MLINRQLSEMIGVVEDLLHLILKSIIMKMNSQRLQSSQIRNDRSKSIMKRKIDRKMFDLSHANMRIDLLIEKSRSLLFHLTVKFKLIMFMTSRSKSDGQITIVRFGYGMKIDCSLLG